MLPAIPPSWRALLNAETKQPYFRQLDDFVSREQSAHAVYPPTADIYAALKLTPYESVKVLLLGQDPYPGEGHAHGLCFSVRPGVRPPASLRNIYRELEADIGGFRSPNNGFLAPWAEQGILMLNTTLTVRAGEPNSHRGHGWETFTDAVIGKVNERDTPVVFVLWGAAAQQKSQLIDERRHAIIKSAHPSPLSARHGFFGSRPFSAINRALRASGQTEINWQIPDL